MNEAQLWDLERDFWLADAAHYESRLAPQALMVLPPPAGVLDRPATLRAIAAAPRWRAVMFSRQQALSPHPQVAVLVYEAHAQRGSTQVPYTAQCSSTYVLLGADWRLAAHQQTPLPMA